MLRDKRQAAENCSNFSPLSHVLHVLDFSLTVKAATLILIYERGSATCISSAKQGRSGYIE